MIGFLSVIKPKGINSTKVVSLVKRITGEKVGHLGTLDPLAEGVLPIAIGKATRLFNYFLNKQKTYIATCEFGYETTTLDSSGDVVQKSQKVPTINEIIKILPKFVGKMQQIPPEYSAKRVNGERAYDLARQGIKPSLKPRAIQIYKLELIGYENKQLTLRMEVSGGTYVRAIFRDIAKELKTFATTTMINRIASGPFTESSSLHFNEITLNAINQHLITIEEALVGLKTITINKSQEKELISGKLVKIERQDEKNVVIKTEDGFIYGLADIVNEYVKISAFLLENNA